MIATLLSCLIVPFVLIAFFVSAPGIAVLLLLIAGVNKR